MSIPSAISLTDIWFIFNWLYLLKYAHTYYLTLRIVYDYWESEWLVTVYISYFIWLL